MHRTSLLVLLVSATALVPAVEPKITLRDVKNDGLTQEIRGHRGKVIVVDIWAHYCVPCKREFPHLVALQQKYAKDGLVAIAVTVDDAKNAEHRAAAIDFLSKVKATGVLNLLLDEEPAVWQARFRIDGPPAVFVFDRDNRIALKLPAGDAEVDYGVVEKKVQELLKK